MSCLTKNFLCLHGHAVGVTKIINDNCDKLNYTVLSEGKLDKIRLFLANIFLTIAATANKENYTAHGDEMFRAINFALYYSDLNNYRVTGNSKKIDREKVEKFLPNNNVINKLYDTNSVHYYTIITAALSIMNGIEEKDKKKYYALFYYTQSMIIGMQLTNRLIINNAVAKLLPIITTKMETLKLAKEKSQIFDNVPAAVTYFTGSEFNKEIKTFSLLRQDFTLSIKKLKQAICRIFLWSVAFVIGLILLPMIVPFFGIVFAGESIAILVGITIGIVTANWSGIVGNAHSAIKWNGRDKAKSEWKKHQIKNWEDLEDKGTDQFSFKPYDPMSAKPIFTVGGIKDAPSCKG